MGGDFPRRWTQTREALEVLKALWTQDEAEYHGTYFDFPPVRCFPKPAQQPAPADHHRWQAPKRARNASSTTPTAGCPTGPRPTSIREARAELDRLATAPGGIPRRSRSRSTVRNPTGS